MMKIMVHRSTCIGQTFQGRKGEIIPRVAVMREQHAHREPSSQGDRVHIGPEHHQRAQHGENIPDDQLDRVSVDTGHRDRVVVLVMLLMDILVEPGRVQQAMRPVEEKILAKNRKQNLP